MDEALDWIREESEKPFFLYLALTIPHANNEKRRGLGDGQEVPDYGIYTEKDWSRPNKGQAAMITRMDRDMGRLFALLRAQGIAERTLVVFSSDNGHHREGGNDPEFFDANGPLRGMKRDLYEGGIRVPTLAWWPGTIEAGSAWAGTAYFGDWMATVCELTGQALPEDVQSVSFLPALTGRLKDQGSHAYLYWEFHEGKGKQALRFGKWKAVRQPFGNGHIELYDLSRDLGERINRAVQRPDLVQQVARWMDEARVEDPRQRK
jgi:arylsulfatase A-like enzyme